MIDLTKYNDLKTFINNFNHTDVQSNLKTVNKIVKKQMLKGK